MRMNRTVRTWDAVREGESRVFRWWPLAVAQADLEGTVS